MLQEEEEEEGGNGNTTTTNSLIIMIRSWLLEAGAATQQMPSCNILPQLLPWLLSLDISSSSRRSKGETGRGVERVAAT